MRCLALPRCLRLVRWISLCACAGGLVSLADAQRNNVLILLADDVGVDKVGAYGLSPNPPPTPNLNALAARGIVFRNAWANPACAPTRACIQTGRYSFRTGVGTANLDKGGVLRYEETTIPELLDAAGVGYAHAAIGKWHLSDGRNGGPRGPNLAGWSHYAGALLGTASYYRWAHTVNGVTKISRVYNTTQTVNDALAWVRSVPEPWVCYLAFPAAHKPFHNPPARLHTYKLPVPPSTPAVLQQFKAMVQAMDTEIGRLFAGLGEQLARTEVIFMGDNGTPAGIVGRPFPPDRGKHTLYQGGVLVPLIIAGPSVHSPGREVDAMVGAVDLFATVADLCGADPRPPGLLTDSISLMPYLRDPGRTPIRSTILAETFIGDAETTPHTQVAFRDDRYKFIDVSWKHPGEEFYDLLDDPYEANNLLRGKLTTTQRYRYWALRQGVSQLRFPRASIATYGTSIRGGPDGRASASATGLAPLGSRYTVALKNAEPSAPAVFLVEAGPRSSPAALFAVDSMGARATGLAAVAMTDARGGASVTLRVPNDPVLSAGSSCHSWLSAPSAPLESYGIAWTRADNQTCTGMTATVAPRPTAATGH